MTDAEMREAFASIHRRLDAQDRDISLCVNYVRELAKLNMTATAIRRIDRQLEAEHAPTYRDELREEVTQPGE